MMKNPLPMFALLALPTVASAGLPLLNATCPGGIEVHADAGGPVYLNGQQAAFKKLSDNDFEAKGAGVTVSIGINPDGSASVMYTGKHGANGICQVAASGSSATSGKSEASHRVVIKDTPSGFKLEGRERGHCKLANVEVGRELYNGTCRIKQTVNGASTVYEIKMGNTEPYLFAGHGDSWMHGPDNVKFRDHGNWGVFRWGDFRLEVHED